MTDMKYRYDVWDSGWLDVSGVTTTTTLEENRTDLGMSINQETYCSKRWSNDDMAMSENLKMASVRSPIS